MKPITSLSWIQKLKSAYANISRKKLQRSLSNFTYDLYLGEREYFVAFMNPDEPYPLQGLMQDGFRHCFIFYKGERCWLMLNPTRWFLHVMELSCYPDDPFPEHLKANHPEITILKITTRLAEKAFMYFRPMTCVSHVAYILGLNKLFLFTPHQLYRCLRHTKDTNIVNVQEIL